MINNLKKYWWIIFIFLFLFAVLFILKDTFLFSKDGWNKTEREINGTITNENNQTEVANPASVFCGTNGGTLNIINEVDGQKGICSFPDGSQCEEWAFYRGECYKKNISL